MRNPPGPPKWWNLKRGEYDASAESNKQKWLYELWNYTRFGDGITLVSEYLAPGETDATSAFQAALDVGCGICIDGKFLISDTLVITKPVHLFGFGECSQIIVASSMSATTDIIEINPDLSEVKFQWTIKDFHITAQSGTPARHVFHVDITTTNKFWAKSIISNVRADNFGGEYFKLTNPTNTDGYFTSQCSDNFCEGGFDLIRSGDSLYFEKNTIAGAGIGPAFTIEQVDGAATIGIKNNNCTASGGLVSLKRYCRNVLIEGNNVETVHAVFDGDNSAAISIDGATGPSWWTENSKVIHNNVNTFGNCDRCIYVGYSTRTIIQDNWLLCTPASEDHITISANAYNTIIGPGNLYLNNLGQHVDATITDNGIGTMGILKDYTITLSSWALIDATNNHAAQYIKDGSGMVTMFGALEGPETAAGATLFTLPVGFRPPKIVKFWTHSTPGNEFIAPTGVYDNIAAAAITPTSAIQTPFNGATLVFGEVTGTPGIDVSVDFEDVPKILGLVVRAYYAGGAGHYIDVSLYNYITTNNDVVMRLDNATNYNYRTILIPANSAYISSGDAQVNFIHPSNGVPAHTGVTVDYVALITSTSTNGTPHVIDVLPSGAVQTPAGGATSVYLDGMTWYSDPISV